MNTNIKRYILIAAAVLALAASALMGVVLANKLSGDVGSLNPDDNINMDIYTDEEGDPLPDEPLYTEDGRLLIDENVLEKPSKEKVNILFLGVNDGLSDTIMLASMDNKEKKLKLLSIPRDTRIVFGGETDKINHLMNYKGTYLNVMEAVKSITGLPIHYYCVVELGAFANIVDILGGVEIDVSFDMYYYDEERELEYSVPKGKRVLSGHEAEGYVRMRKMYPDADLGRIRAQQNFISEMVKQKLTLSNILKAPRIYSEIEKNIKTNYDKLELAAQLMAMKGLSSEDIESYTLPGEGREAYIRYGWSDCFIYYQNATEQLITEHFRSNIDLSKFED